MFLSAFNVNEGDDVTTSTSLRLGILPTALVACCLLTFIGGLLPAGAQDQQSSPSSTMKRRLARIKQKLEYIESRLLVDDSDVVNAQSMTRDQALAAGVIEQPWLPSRPLHGRLVFEQKNCNQCHAISGAGGSTGPDLVKTFFRGSFLDLGAMLWNHIPDMLVEYKSQKLVSPKYTDEEVANLISYLYYLRYLGVPGDVSRGEKLIEEKNCVKCHVSGQNGVDVGPEFDRIKMYASPLELAQALWNHEPTMVETMRRLNIPRPSFTGQEISDLSAYVRAASRSPQTDRIYVSPGSPLDGAKVYTAKGCGSCHSNRQSGAPSLASLSLHKSAAEIGGMMWNHGEQMFEKMQDGAIAWPIFEGKEMADLIAFLYFIKFVEPPGNAAIGKTFFLEKNCGTCHSIRGVGGSIGPDLAQGTSHRTNIGILTAMLNHSETMSEALLVKGESWPLLSGREMRDIFAYLKSVNARIPPDPAKAVAPSPTTQPATNNSAQPSSTTPSPATPNPTKPDPTEPDPGSETQPKPTPAATGSARNEADEEPIQARKPPNIPDGYQLVTAMLATARGDNLVERLRDSLGEEQMKQVKLSFHPSGEFISKAAFTWTPRDIKGEMQIHVFLPKMFAAGLAVKLDGETVWSPPHTNGRNVMSPLIDLKAEQPNLSITVEDRGGGVDANGGVDDIYILQVKKPSNTKG